MPVDIDDIWDDERDMEDASLDLVLSGLKPCPRCRAYGGFSCYECTPHEEDQ